MADPLLTYSTTVWYCIPTPGERRSHAVQLDHRDLDDDPDGNVQHCAAHGATKEEVEEVLQNAADEDISRSSRCVR